MAKKRKASGPPAVEDTPAGWNERGGKLGPINTFEDVADSEDEFHINRDNILLEDGPDTKRIRKWQEEDALLEYSDEEVLAYSSESEEDDATNEADAVVSSDIEGPEGEDEDAGGWGTSKKDYYDNDNIETEADALEEEQEARRLQQKRLQKMTEADFGLDELDWVTGHEGMNENEGDVVTEVLEDIEITPDMSPKERLNILQTRYPEFGSLANELVELHPLLEDLRRQILTDSVTDSTRSTVSSKVVKARALAAYVGSLAMYFAILSSPAKNSQSMPLDPTELRDHAVMDSLLRCRQLWTQVKSLNTPAPAQSEVSVEHKAMVVELEHITSGEQSTKKNQLKAGKPNQKTKKQLAIEAASASLDDLSALVARRTKNSLKPVTVRSDDGSSDFGEETSLTAKDAAAKATRRKNLSFYTSQIAQKANKRGEKGREAGGDMDLPHKERFRDRQARLNAEAEARGKQLDEYGRGGKGVALEQEGDSEDDEAIARGLRGDEDEYYDLISKSSKDRKRTNEEHRSAIRQAKEQNSLLRVVEGEIDEDGKRAIGYVIEKNRGLAPKRKKDVRNPRVKKRKKFEEKKKKLSSVRAVYKGGEERGGYGGEKTGIKTNLVKSVKL